jgi:intracellular proteinase inhibitor BsuPI
MTHASRRVFAILAVALAASFALYAAQKSSPLSYRLEVKPGDITLANKSAADSAAAAARDETITFTVMNTSDIDYEGTAPTCQTFDVEIFRSDSSGEKSVWKWSRGQMFCQQVTTVVIPSGLKWQQTVKWNFNVAAVQPGKYRVDATFMPEAADASATFEIH